MSIYTRASLTALAAGLLVLAGCERTPGPTEAPEPFDDRAADAGSWFTPGTSADAWTMVPEARLGSGVAFDSHDDPAVRVVAPESLTCGEVIDFSDVPDVPLVSVEGILTSGSATFAEKFEGQELTYAFDVIGSVGGHDILSGAPGSPLALAPASGQFENLAIPPFTRAEGDPPQPGDPPFALVGLGPGSHIGFVAAVGSPPPPNFVHKLGEGSVAIRFGQEQFEVGFTLVGGDGAGSPAGPVFVRFFEADGTPIDGEILVPSSPVEKVAFRREGGARDIAGISLHNRDPEGLGYANFIVCETIQASIDVKPGSDPSSWGCDAVNGRIPVAILSDDSFDATTVDANTVRFGKNGDEAAEAHQKKGEAMRHEEDVNGDGLTDMVFHFVFGETGFGCEDVPDGDKDATLAAFLNGQTVDGTPVEGEGEIRLVAGGKGSGNGNPNPGGGPGAGGPDDGNGNDKGKGKGRGPH